MTPYTKKIVELHKIHKAIEEKDCCSGGGGNTPSGDITIDDVVKFIHDNIENQEIDIPTKYNDIKHISEPLDNEYNLVRGTEQEIDDFLDSNTDPNITFDSTVLLTTNYNIVVIHNNQVS